MFVDKVKIKVEAGHGGNGCLAFRREKFIPHGGPNGGNGGHGGDVYIVADPQMRTLLDLSLRPQQRAGVGLSGQGSNKQGASGDDLFVRVPLGTVIRSGRNVLGDLTDPGQTLLVAQGGRGGRGNASFKTSTRRAPRIAERGAPGESRDIVLELKLIADVGLIGLPNAGKSTLLSRLTKAHPKIADYPFTTLSPNLGVASYDEFHFALADIPGLVEGAHAGKGLGLEFLRHVERTRLLLHLVDVSGCDGLTPKEAISLINNELAEYSPALARKPQILVLTKTDLTKSTKTLASRLKKRGDRMPVLAISAVTGDGLKTLLKTTAGILVKLPPEPPAAEPPVRYVLQPDFRVHQKGTAFVVSGKKVERLVAMTDFNQYQAVERLQAILKGIGVERELKKAGAIEGDTIRIGPQEFDFQPVVQGAHQR